MPTAVNFEAETFNHGLFSLAASEGRPVVVHFWYPSCPPCEAEALRLQTAYDRHSGDVDFVAVQQTKLDSAAAGAAFVERLGITYPVFADRDDLLGIYYNVSDFPSTVFLDRQHRVHRNVSGTINATELERLVQEVAGS
jgi:peroxiredoxin